VDPDGRVTLSEFQETQAAKEIAALDHFGDLREFLAADSSGMAWFRLAKLMVVHTNPVPVRAYEAEGGVVIEYSDGTKEIRRGGSRAWRNNNPGNLILGGEPTNEAIGTAGAVPGTGWRYAVFGSEESGTRALIKWLRSPSRADLTVGQIIERFAPPKHNDTERYKAFVAHMGVPLGRRMADLEPRQFQLLVQAIRKMEGCIPGEVTWR
ncbi:MAG: hypothetical protein ACP5PX_08260, partial [Candidatus Hadarchaeum sp.]